MYFISTVSPLEQVYIVGQKSYHVTIVGFDVNAVIRATMVKQNYASRPLREDGLMLLLALRCATESLS